MTFMKCDGRTECSILSTLLDCGRQHKRAVLVNPDCFLRWRPQALSRFGGSPLESLQSTLPRKFSKLNTYGTVPKTDTGGHVEKTKANE